MLNEEIQTIKADLDYIKSTLNRMCMLRINKKQLAKLQSCSHYLITQRIENGILPPPDSDGCWSMSDLTEWEKRLAQKKQGHAKNQVEFSLFLTSKLKIVKIRKEGLHV
jgi:hypothetical protein